MMLPSCIFGATRLAKSILCSRKRGSKFLESITVFFGCSRSLFSADYSTPHRAAVIAYDAANEIGLAIKIAKPTGQGAAGVTIPPAVIKKG